MTKIEKLYSEIPDLSGKVCLVTGGNAGIGKVTSKVLLSKGAKVYLAARNKEKAEEAINNIKLITGKNDIHWLPLDLSDLASVVNASKQFTSQEGELHIMINNAGVMGSDLEYTKDGFESIWGTNVVGHFTLIKLLLPTLLHTASISPTGAVRIVNVSSKAHEHFVPKGGIDFNNISLSHLSGSLAGWTRYGQSKLGNILLTKEIVKRYSDNGILSIAIHPGVIKTQLNDNLDKGWTNRILLYLASFSEFSEDEGAYTQVFAATHPKVVEEDLNGKYLIPFGKVYKSTNYSLDPVLASKLWDYLEKEIEGKL